MSKEKEVTNLFGSYTNTYWETVIHAFKNFEEYRIYYDDDECTDEEIMEEVVEISFKIPEKGYRIYLCNDGKNIWFKDTLDDYKSEYLNLFYCFNSKHTYDFFETVLFKEEDLFIKNVNENSVILKDFIDKDTVNNIKKINEHTFVSIFNNEGTNILTNAIYPLVCCDFNNKY